MNKKITVAAAALLFVICTGFISNNAPVAGVTEATEVISSGDMHVVPMELREGTITDPVGRTLIDHTTGQTVLYDNPGGIIVVPGDRVNFIAIIATTPQGERVVRILKEKLN